MAVRMALIREAGHRRHLHHLDRAARLLVGPSRGASRRADVATTREHVPCQEGGERRQLEVVDRIATDELAPDARSEPVDARRGAC